VESPKDAIRCFFSTGLDALAIGNFLLLKKTAQAKSLDKNQNEAVFASK
jgi:carbamoyltransferase